MAEFQKEELSQNEFDQPTESDKEIVEFVVSHCDRWRDHRDDNYLVEWKEYERIFRGKWAAEDRLMTLWTNNLSMWKQLSDSSKKT